MKKAFKILVIIFGILLIAIAGIASYVKFVLPNADPAPDLKVEMTPERIERGNYLANHVLICMDCHSARNYNEFTAPLIPGTLGKGGERFDATMGFPGNYYSANITPAGIGDWTDGEIFRAITTGVRRSGKPIFPVMPYSNYGKLDREDIESVIAYLRSLPPIENKVPESNSEFPMNFIINTIPKKAELTKRPDPSDELAYGKYLITAASCGECHTPVDKGQVIPEFAYGGGREFKLPSGTITSANLTPDMETGIGKWTKQQFLDRFTFYRDSANMHKKVDFMKEFNTIMPWTMYAGMTDADLGAIYAYLRTLKPINKAIVKFQPATPMK
jgi:mono/diheme cytochrome c family protein